MVEIIDTFLKSKTGNSDGGEDKIVMGPHFYGVVDGGTDKTGLNWGTEEVPKAGGLVLAEIVHDVLQTDASPEEIIILVNQQIHQAAALAIDEIDLNNPLHRAAVGFVVYSPAQKVVYYIDSVSVGFVNNNGTFTTHYFRKSVDNFMARLRAATAEWCKSEGIDPFKDGKDLTRTFVETFIHHQSKVQNVPKDSTYWSDLLRIPRKHVAYNSLNGFPTQISILKVPEGTKEIVLATDGYRIIKPTLEETEKVLQGQLKRDPDCLTELRGTKRVMPGNVGFDDRAYLRIRL